MGMGSRPRKGTPVSAKDKLRERLARVPDDPHQLDRFEELIEDAYPREFRASRLATLMEEVQTVRSRLALEIDDLGEDEAAEIIEYLEWVAMPADTLSDEELAEVEKADAAIARGEYSFLEEVRRKLGL
jgi:hypothetical protein